MRAIPPTRIQPLVVALAWGLLLPGFAAAELRIDLAFEDGGTERVVATGETVVVEAWLTAGDVGVWSYGFSVHVPHTDPLSAVIREAAAVLPPGFTPFVQSPFEVVQPGSGAAPRLGAMGVANDGWVYDFNASRPFGTAAGLKNARVQVGTMAFQIPCVPELELTPFFLLGEGVLTMDGGYRDLSDSVAFGSVRVVNPDGARCSSQAMVGVSPPAVELGESALLSWDSAGVEDCQASGGWMGSLGPRGSVEVIVSETTDYSIHCTPTQGGEPIEADATLSVAVPPALRMGFDPLRVGPDRVSTVSWESENAEGCAFASELTGELPAAGSRIVGPGPDHSQSQWELMIVCSGAPGTSPARAWRTVSMEATAPTIEVDVDPIEVPIGSPMTISWVAEGAADCAPMFDMRGVSAGLLGQGSRLPASGSLTYTPSESDLNRLMLGLDCSKAPLTFPATSMTVVTVLPVATIDLEADLLYLREGETTALSWTSIDIVGCEASGGWSGERLMSGTEEIAPTTTSSYVLTCLTASSETSQAAFSESSALPGLEGDWLQDRVIVEVAPANAPDNDRCEEAPSLVPSQGGGAAQARVVDTSGAIPSIGDPTPSCGLGSDGATVWFALTSSEERPIRLHTAGSDYDTVVSVWAGGGESCGALVEEVACNDDGAGVPHSSLTWVAKAGDPYLIQIGARNAGVGGNLQVTVIPEPAASRLIGAGLLALAALVRLRGMRDT